ncbi:MAG: V-type ATP synthase subunit I [Methanomassiliicoccales archaeon]|nr:V-type ATP synthase subunit I [Methanomassiliicoccales archaeon]
MLLPEQMVRVLVVGSKDLLERTVDLLYELECVHLIDFPADEEGFTLGSPLPAASDASQKLLRLRAMQKDLGIEEMKGIEPIRTDALARELDQMIESLHQEISDVVESKKKIELRLSELEQERKNIEPFVGLPLELDLYTGYKSLVVFTGYVKLDPEGVLRESIEKFELFKSEDGKFIALFVGREESEEAQRILVQHGFSEVPVPPKSGKPDKILESILAEEETLRKSIADLSEKLEKMREKHATFALAAEEHLSIIVQKAETPLRVGASAHSFIIEAWVPEKNFEQLQKAFAENLGERIYVEVLERRERREAEGHHDEGDEAPVKIENPKPFNLFEYLVELISTPKYNELDPTPLISIFFPIFFGLMVGDVGYGIPFVILGYLGLKKCTSNEWRTIATMLFFGGIFTIIFGLFMFGEAFALHFAPSPYGEVTWSSLLGIEIPHHLEIGPLSIPLGVYSKLHDVKMLLYISIWIGVIHLFVGYALGFINVTIRHGLKHAIFEKLSWLFILIGAVMLGLVLLDGLVLSKPLVMTDVRMIGGLITLIVGIVLGFRGEGAGVVLELPGLVSNIMSYSRLAAIGMSKAGMALAFNMIAIEMIAPGGGVMIAVAFAIFAVGHMMIFILAVISAGLHGIRLQYVEFFTKFYEGGGLKFNPLRIRRKYTTEV